MIVTLLFLCLIHTIQGCDVENLTVPQENPCASVRCVRGWCEAFYQSALCRCDAGFWGYLCEHEGNPSGSLFWDYLPLQEEAYLTGRIDSEEEDIHPLCQIGSFSHKRRTLPKRQASLTNRRSLSSDVVIPHGKIQTN